MGRFDFTIIELINFDIAKFKQIELQLVWEVVKKKIPQIHSSKIKRTAFIDLCKQTAKEWNVKGVERLVRINVDVVPLTENKAEVQIKEKPETINADPLDFATKINEQLPDQPWKPGIHIEICERIGCSRNDYFEAVKMLIEEGLRYRQKDGVVYDEDGNVISFDQEHVDAETLKIKGTAIVTVNEKILGLSYFSGKKICF